VRVLALTNMLPSPDRPWYGVFVQDQIEDLRALGVDVSVLFIDGRTRRFDYLRAIGRLRRALDERDVDLVHAHYGLSGAIAVMQRDVPVVTTFHGSDCNGDIRWQKVVSWVVARLSTPVFVSEALASSVGRMGSTVIPAAVDLEVFQPQDRIAARRALGWPNDGDVALLPGSRHDPAKGAELFDAAVAHARRELPSLRGVSLEGLSREQVALTMNAADVTVMTSRREGSPVAVKESLACLTPVVSVSVGDVEGLLVGLPGCAVVPRNPRSLAEAITRAVSSPRSSGLRARTSKFGRPETARRVVDVYRHTLANANGRT